MSGWLGWDWGNVPAWVGAITSAAGLGFAGRQVQLNTMQRRQEAEQRAEESARLRRRHARAVWVRTELTDREDFRVSIVIKATNSGEGPVLDAMAAYEIPPGFSNAGNFVQCSPQRIESGRTVDWPITLHELVEEGTQRFLSFQDPLQVALNFIDLDGVRWSCNNRNGLVEDPT